MKISVEVNENGAAIRFTVTLSPGGTKGPVTEEFGVSGADTSVIEEWLQSAADAHQPEGDAPKITSEELIDAFHRIVGELSHKLVAIEQRRNNKPHLGFGALSSR